METVYLVLAILACAATVVIIRKVLAREARSRLTPQQLALQEECEQADWDVKQARATAEWRVTRAENELADAQRTAVKRRLGGWTLTHTHLSDGARTYALTPGTRATFGVSGQISHYASSPHSTGGGVAAARTDKKGRTVGVGVSHTRHEVEHHAKDTREYYIDVEGFSVNAESWSAVIQAPPEASQLQVREFAAEINVTAHDSLGAWQVLNEETAAARQALEVETATAEQMVADATRARAALGRAPLDRR